MQSIDFLPNQIREKHARRRARLAQSGFLLLVAGAVVAAALGQLALRKSVEGSLADLQGRYAQAKTKHAEYSKLIDQLRTNEEVAELAVYLRHPWPRTQLVATIVEALPPTVAIDELAISARTVRRKEVRSNQVQINSTNEPTLPAARQDLHDLRESAQKEQTVIELSGRSRDASALHDFVARLDQAELFQEAKLDSLETREVGNAATFLVRIVVRPSQLGKHSSKGV